MKTAAFILAIVWGGLMGQLPFTNPIATSASCSQPKPGPVRSSCPKAKPVQSSCTKSKCGKTKPAKEKNDCSRNRCNPLMSCPTGNFYISDYSQIAITSFTIYKQKTPLVNDNRVSKTLTECWHPPEII